MQKTKTKGIVEKARDFIKHPFIRKNKPLLHTIEWVFILLAFFSVGFAVLLFQTSSNRVIELPGDISSEKQASIQTVEQQQEFVGEMVQEPIDTTAWDVYRNKYYGFEIQHPDAWENNTQYKTATEKSARYETIYKFRKNGEGAGGVFEGYDVKIYSVKKTPDVADTNDIRKKEGAPEDTTQCELAEEVSFGSEETYFQKVSVKEGNPCYQPAYFYSITKGNYIFNIVPAVGESGERFSNPEKETSAQFPEYKEAVSTLKFMPIVRTAVQPAKPRITAKRPVAAKIVGGKMVCAKKNDKPRKSKQNKPGHLDLECCLDPDERPNPWCSY